MYIFITTTEQLVTVIMVANSKQVSLLSFGFSHGLAAYLTRCVMTAMGLLCSFQSIMKQTAPVIGKIKASLKLLCTIGKGYFESLFRRVVFS